MATATELAVAFRAAEVRRAAAIAAAVAIYYNTRVDVDDPASVERWLALVIPRLENEAEQGARRAAALASRIRALEAPRIPALTFDPRPGSNREQIRKSLQVVGPFAHYNKMRDIRRADLPPSQARALEKRALETVSKNLTASAVRHALSGSRNTTESVVAQDRTALGYIRVTQAKPCFFCAMLASRGRIFSEDSFDMSDPRFIGPGNAKVHDGCGCHLKASWIDKDPALERNQRYVDFWEEWGAGGGDALLRFRRGYEHWERTGEMLTWEQANARPGSLAG